MSNRIQEELQHLNSWLMEQSHKPAKTDNQLLLNFLYGCKFSRQKTKEKLGLFFTIRRLMPEFFNNRDPFLHDIQEFLQQGAIVLLPSTPRIILVRSKNVNPENFNPSTLIKVLLTIFDMLLIEDNNFASNGVQVIIDLHEIPHKCIMPLTPSLFRKLVSMFQHVYPISVKGIHVINTPEYFKVIFQFLMTYAPEKVRKRINIYTEGNLDIFHKQLKVMPYEYGGNGGSFKEMAAGLRLQMEQHNDWFVEYCSDTTKHDAKPKIFTDICGSSSKKLDLDYQEYIIFCRHKYK